MGKIHSIRISEMKRKYLNIVLILIAIFTFQWGFGQKKINQLDSNGERTGVWKKYYNNGRLRYQGQFDAGKEKGVFKFYSALNSDHPILVKAFEPNSNKAQVKFYTEKGILKSAGEMQGKLRTGKWVYYHKEGKKVLSIEHYINAELNGNSQTYYKSGKITEDLNYKNGKLHGNLKRYADSGVLLDDLNYVRGKLEGAAKYYNVQGKLVYWGDYENDEKIGKWEYFEKGKPIDFDEIKEE